MTAGIHNFTIDQGSDKNKKLTFYTDATQTITVDLSAVSEMRMQMRRTKQSINHIDELTDSNGRIDTTDAATGVIILQFAASISSAYDFDTCYYDLEFVTGSVVERIIEGVITLDLEVTR